MVRRSDPNSKGDGISALFSLSSKPTQRPLRSTASVIVPACAPVIAPGGSPVVAAIDPTPPPAIILRILGGNAVELFRIYFGAFRTFRTTSTLRRRSFRRGSPGDHKASCRRETTDQAEQECTSFHKLFSIDPRGSLLASSQVSRHAPGPGPGSRQQLVRENLALRRGGESRASLPMVRWFVSNAARLDAIGAQRLLSPRSPCPGLLSCSA